MRTEIEMLGGVLVFDRPLTDELAQHAVDKFTAMLKIDNKPELMARRFGWRWVPE